jgi:hypothetical protein
MLHLIVGWVWIAAVGIVLLALAVLAVLRTYYLNENLLRGFGKVLRDLFGRGPRG